MTAAVVLDPAQPIDRLLIDLAALLRQAVQRPAARPGPAEMLPGADAGDETGPPVSRHGARTPFTWGTPADLRPTPAEAWAALEEDRIGERTALGACELLARNPKLRDVVTFLLRPLVEHGLVFDGNAEAILTRRANEFADYRARHLMAAARLLVDGRHTQFPEANEIYAALGRCARPGFAGALDRVEPDKAAA